MARQITRGRQGRRVPRGLNGAAGPARLKALAIGCCAAAALLAGCGGGGGGSDDHGPADEVPRSASRSSEGLVDYLLALFDTDTEQRDPVALGSFEGPTPETERPVELP